MKKFTLALSLFTGLFILNTHAQNIIKNYSFENWSTKNGVLAPDGWTIQDSAKVIGANALQRKTGGSQGSYGIKLGSYVDVFMFGAGVELEDTFNVEPGGISLDYYQSDPQFGMNSVRVHIYFYDSVGDFIKDQSYSFPANRGTAYASGSFYFAFPGTKPKSYLLELFYQNINSSTADFCVVDNIRFLGKGAFTPELSKAPETISLFPNPAQGKLYLNNIPAQDFKISILSADGKFVSQNMQFNSLENSIDITSLPHGIYFLQLEDTNGNWMMNKKFVKMDVGY